MNATGDNKGTGVVAQASSSPSLPAAGPAQAPPAPADDLRRFADWLDEHPDECPVYIVVRLAATSREDMVRIAAALGDGVTERLDYAQDVQLSKMFGCINVFASVPVDACRPGAPPPPPEWDRILPVAAEETELPDADTEADAA